MLIRTMRDTDIPLGMRLKAQAGWNQTPADWQRYLALQPDGCFVAEDAGGPAGTLTTCLFPEEAWIAMVLVDERRRGQGIATALLTHALAFLDARRVASVRLDATPQGQPIYERLGFVAEYPLARYIGIVAPAPAAVAVQAYRTEHLDALLRLDRQLLGIDRGKLLRRLLEEEPAQGRIVLRAHSPAGYLMARRGALAWHLGQCVWPPARRGSCCCRMPGAASAGRRCCLTSRWRMHVPLPARRRWALRRNAGCCACAAAVCPTPIRGASGPAPARKRGEEWG